MFCKLFSPREHLHRLLPGVNIMAIMKSSNISLLVSLRTYSQGAQSVRSIYDFNLHLSITRSISITIAFTSYMHPGCRLTSSAAIRQGVGKLVCPSRWRGKVLRYLPAIYLNAFVESVAEPVAGSVVRGSCAYTHTGESFINIMHRPHEQLCVPATLHAISWLLNHQNVLHYSTHFNVPGTEPYLAPISPHLTRIS